MTISRSLSLLEAGGLIQLAATHPELEYAFRHALIQEATYQTLVRSNRRMLHKIVGESLEQMYLRNETTAATLAPVLARHFSEADDLARALKYYVLAGRTAAQVYANAEAIHHFGQALEIAVRGAAGVEQIADLFLQRGFALELNAQDAEAVQNYLDMEAWAVSASNQKAELAAINARATIYVKPTVLQNYRLGYELSQRALALARGSGDRPAEAKALWNLLQYHAADSNMDEALSAGEQALQIAREEGLREQEAYVLTDLHKVYFMGDRRERAMTAVDEARAIWRELGKLNMLADNLASTSLILAMTGEFQSALDLSAEAQHIAHTIGNLWNQSYALYMVDLIHFDRGDVGQAIRVAEECQRLAEQAGFGEGIHQSAYDLAWMHGFMGQHPRALDIVGRTRARFVGVSGYFEIWSPLGGLEAFLLARAGRLAEARAVIAADPLGRDPDQLQVQSPVAQFHYYNVYVELALSDGEYPRAIELTEALMAGMRHLGLRFGLSDALLLKARVLRAAGRTDEARATLEAARAEAEDLGSRRTLWEILGSLADLAVSRGESLAAIDMHRHAAVIIAYIAEHAGSTELSESFLSRPDVRATLAAARQSDKGRE